MSARDIAWEGFMQQQLNWTGNLVF